jgi:nucleoside-diphosphate-sugar epimerase
MRYFMTGATGFLGGHVARMLRQDGHEVAALARSPQKAQDLAALGIEIFEGDLTDKESMRRPMSGADGIFHIAAWYGYGAKDPDKVERVNVGGTRNVLELMQELGISKGVYTSTLSVNSCTGGVVADESYRFSGQHLSLYDESKARAHQIAEDFIANGLPLVIAMPGVIYGPGDTSLLREFLLAMLKRRLLAVEPSMTLTWGYVDDIAGAHIKAMEKGVPGETYIIAGPTHTVGEVVALVEEISGVKAPMHTSVGMQRGLSKVMGVVEKFFTVPDMFCSEYLSTTAGRYYIGSNAKAQRELGYNPRSLREGMEITLRHEMALLGMTAPSKT